MTAYFELISLNEKYQTVNMNILFPLYIFQLVGSMCGESHWRAAKDRSKTMKNLDETGLCMASCRHAVLQMGINMYQVCYHLHNCLNKAYIAQLCIICF